MVTLRFALVQSCNRPFTRLAEELGEKVNAVVKRFGMTPPEEPALVPIGGVMGSPLELAREYASLANNGRLPRVRFLAMAIGPNGNVLGAPATRDEPIATSMRTANAVLHDLRGPVRFGTARAADSKYVVVYGKTGTSSDNVDALFVGITKEFVGSIWMGYDMPTTMPGGRGGGAPAEAFLRITDAYYGALARAQSSSSRYQTIAGQWRGVFQFLSLDKVGSFLAPVAALVMLVLLLLEVLRFRGARPRGRLPTMSPPSPNRQTTEGRLEPIRGVLRPGRATADKPRRRGGAKPLRADPRRS